MFYGCNIFSSLFEDIRHSYFQVPSSLHLFLHPLKAFYRFILVFVIPFEGFPQMATGHWQVFTANKAGSCERLAAESGCEGPTVEHRQVPPWEVTQQRAMSVSAGVPRGPS